MTSPLKGSAAAAPLTASPASSLPALALPAQLRLPAATGVLTLARTFMGQEEEPRPGQWTASLHMAQRAVANAAQLTAGVPAVDRELQRIHAALLRQHPVVDRVQVQTLFEDARALLGRTESVESKVGLTDGARRRMGERLDALLTALIPVDPLLVQKKGGEAALELVMKLSEQEQAVGSATPFGLLLKSERVTLVKAIKHPGSLSTAFETRSSLMRVRNIVSSLKAGLKPPRLKPTL